MPQAQIEGAAPLAQPASPASPPSPAPPPAPVAPALDWRRLHAFGLPGGSVRAVLAVLVFGGIWTWLWRRPDREMPPYLSDLMFIILGHYFAARAGREAGEAPGPPPLYLPRGTIRLLVVLGFASVAGVLSYQRRLWASDAARGVHLNPGGVTLILVGGFLVGVVLARLRQWWAARGRRLPRIVEDVRATVSLAAAVALLLILFGLWSPPEGGGLAAAQHFLSKYRIEDALAAVVGFYFGSRS